MAEEVLDQTITGDPVPKQGLANEHRAKLDSIVQQMIKNKESDSDIQMVVNDFKEKYSTKPPATQQPKQEQPAFQLSEPTLRAIPKESAVTPSAPNEKINIPREQVSYVPDEKTVEIQKQSGKARLAHENVNAALVSNDAQYEKKLRESRKDNYTIESLRNEYKQNGQILSPQDEQSLLQKKKEQIYNLPVSKEDLTDFKTGTILTPKLSRKFIKDLNDKDVSESAYQVDKFNELANDPSPSAHERIAKINEIAKGIKKGTYVYNPETKTVVQPLGLVGSIMEGVKNKFKADEEHDFLKNTSNDAAIVMELENERNNPDVDQPIKVPRGKLNEALNTIAEMPITPIVAGVAGTIGGTFIGNPELGTVAAASLGAYENRKAQYRSTFKQVYNELRDQGKPEFDALAEARKQAENAQEIGTIVGAAQGLVGAKIGEIPIKGTTFSLGYQQAVGQFLKNNGSEFGKIALDAAAQGGLGVAGEIAKNKLAQAAGIKRDWDAGTADAFYGNALMAGGIGAALKLGRGISKINYKTILSGLTKSVPEEAINSTLQEKVSNGEITQAAADQALNEINQYKAKDAQIPANVTEEARFKIQDNIDKITELEQQKEATHKSLQGPIKERIDKLIDENLALSRETVKEEKPVSGLSKDKEKEAIDFAHELVDEGILPDTYAAEAKKDPIKFWQTIAQQAQNRDENWKLLSQPLDEQAVKDNYGDTVVDYAKELFPAPGIPEPSKLVSVIQPGEIKHPENITIKSQEHAIPIGSPEEIHVGETSSDSQPMGEGISKPGEITGTQEGQSQKTNTPADQEGVGHPTVLPGAINVYAERPPTQLSFRGLQDTANEFGYEDVNPRDRKSDIQTKSNAEKTANEWASRGEYRSKIDEMLDKIDKKQMVPTDEQRLILEQDLANQKQILRDTPKSSPEYDAQFAKVKRLKGIGNTARSEAGAALRLPEGGSRPHPITDEVDAMVAKAEANGVDKLTDQQKAEVEAQVEKYRQASDEANKKVADLEDRVAKLDAQKGFDKIKTDIKGESKSQSGNRAKIIDNIKNKWYDEKLDIITDETINNDASKNTVDEYLRKANGVLKKLFPDVEVKVYDTANEYRRIEQRPLGSRGVYDPVGKRIAFNMEDIRKANSGKTIFHEIIHPIINEVIAKDEGVLNNLYSRLNDFKDLPGMEKVWEHENKYRGRGINIVKVEALTEFMALVADGKIDTSSLSKSTLVKVIDFINKVFEKIGSKIKINSPEDLKALSDSIKMALKQEDTSELEHILSNRREGAISESVDAIHENSDRIKRIAPYVKELVKGSVRNGMSELGVIVKSIHDELKGYIPEITERDIHDIIAGEYNEAGRPLSEMQRQVRDLQDEAKLINQIEALENGVEPKTEKAKRERNQKIKALRDKIQELKATDGADELRAIKKRNEELVKKIKDTIASGQFEKETKKSIFDREDIKQKHPQLRKEALNAIAKKEEAQHEFDLALFNDEMRKREWYQKAGSFGAKLIHTSKAIMSGIDDSATFVQNGLAILANPKIGAKAFVNHAKDAFSDARFKRELAALHSRPDWEIIKNSGLDIVEPHSAASKQVEEAFEQNLLAEIKIKGIKPWDYTGGIFERAFTSMGNNMRLLLFEKRMAALQDQGKTFESHPKEYKDAARVINELTGRGKLPAGLAQASPYITPFIWAPRMLASTLNTLGIGEVMGLKGKGYYQNLTPMQRKFALSQLGRGVGIGVALMGAAALGGAKVDYDPRSVTFGDVIFGDHHYNVFGRFTPVIKVLVQAGMGKRIKGGGQEQDLDSGKFGAKTRADVVYGFIRGKTTPAIGTALNLMEGRNYFTNEKFTIKDVPGALLQPMSIKELRDGWHNDGSATILNRFLPAFEGMKTSDERDFNKKGGSGGGAGATGSISHKTTKIKRIIPHKTHR